MFRRLALAAAFLGLAFLPASSSMLLTGAGTGETTCADGVTTVFLTKADSSPYAKPPCWNNNNNTVEVIGAGGGSGVNSSKGGSGAGGQAKTYNVTLAATNAFSVGVGATNTDGTNTWFCNDPANCATIAGSAVVAGANGGKVATSGTGGAGGATSGEIGDVTLAGCAGGTTSGTTGGGGGGSLVMLNQCGAGGTAASSGAGGGGGTGRAATSGGTGSNGGGSAGGNGGEGIRDGHGSGATSSIAATDGTNGGGGGGGFNSTNTSGGAGSTWPLWDATHGPGSGGGGNAANSLDAPAGNGGNYGGGAGGRAAASTGAVGGDGLIAIRYVNGNEVAVNFCAATDTANTATIACTTTSDVAAGETVALLLSEGITSASISSISDGTTNVYTQTESQGATNQQLWIYYNMSPLAIPSGSTITVTFGSASTQGKMLYGFRMNGAYTPRGYRGKATGASGSPSCSTSAAVGAGGLVFGIAMATTALTNPGGIWTSDFAGTLSSRFGAIAHGNPSSLAVQTYAPTNATSTWTCIIQSFQ